MESSYQPPVRKSLSDEELAARVNQATSSHSGIEAVMELLVAQEALRAQEDSEIANWVIQMENDGSPEAVRALANFRGGSQEHSPIEETHDEPVIDSHPVEEEEPAQETLPAAEANPFSWFLRTNEAPVVKQSEPVEIVVDEPVIDSHPVEEEEPAQETLPAAEANPFSWFLRTNEAPVVKQSEPVEIVVEEPVVEVPVEETLVVVEETLVVVEEPQAVEASVIVESELHREGTESIDAFDQLLAAASAEEELTALEEVKEVTKSDSSVSNVTIPSDENRDRKPLSQVFVWLGATATVVPILLVVALLSFGLSANAILTDLIVGYLISGILVATAALAGKRSGLSTSMVSRAVFGVWGNSLPLALLFLARVIVTALIVTVFTLALNGVETNLHLFDTVVLNVLGINFSNGLIIQVLILTVVALLTFAKGGAWRIIQMVMSCIALVLVLESFGGLLTVNLKLSAPGQLGIMSKESLAGIALVVMVSLTLWFAIAPNLAKSIPMKQRGAKVFGAVLVSNFVMPLVIAIPVLLWLGSSTSGLFSAVATLPKWSSGALLSGVQLSLIYIAFITLKTATFDLVALVRLKSNAVATATTFAVVIVLLVLFAQQPIAQQVEYLLNVFVLAAALLAGWIGMFAADVALRKIAYHELSLSRSYGFYKKFNVLSFVLWVLSLASAVAFIPVDLRGFSFFGFALPMLGLEANLGSAALGFLLTVLLGIVLTIAARIPQIRKQEREVLAVESRREQLNDIFVGQE